MHDLVDFGNLKHLYEIILTSYLKYPIYSPMERTEIINCTGRYLVSRTSTVSKGTFDRYVLVALPMMSLQKNLLMLPSKKTVTRA